MTTQSFQESIATNYELLPSGYTGSRGDVGPSSDSGDPRISFIDITDSNYTVLADTTVSITGGYIKLVGARGMFPFNGYMSDFRVTKGHARYTANFTPPAVLFQAK